MYTQQKVKAKHQQSNDNKYRRLSKHNPYTTAQIHNSTHTHTNQIEPHQKINSKQKIRHEP